MRKHHAIITGTGRAGTTFLVQLLTNLGLDTGNEPFKESLKNDAHAGLERDLNENAPYIVKNPYYRNLLVGAKKQKAVIDYAIIPMRNLHAASESRRIAEKKGRKKHSHPIVAGGLYGVKKPEKQEDFLKQCFYQMMLDLSAESISVILMHYPRLTKDPAYVHDKLKPLVGDIANERFVEVFEKTVDPSLVHQHGGNDKWPI
jgi:hypothetical protein